MQPLFSCTDPVLNEIETAISPARLARYMHAARGDKHLALRLYLFNARLCQEFYIPLQTAELCIRNSVTGILIRRFGLGWYSNHKFVDILPDRHKNALTSTVFREQMDRMGAFTGDHVVAALTFGFWSQLFTKNFAHILWQAPGIYRALPHAPQGLTQGDVHDRIEAIRTFRNDVAHHYAIFDKRPLERLQVAMEVISWISPHTNWLVRQMVNPHALVAAKPKF
ncbi:hypothetical protein [uncultured Sphingomonas sp.]|uniref:hypothetical protein n=1 Tax=uncultured Sphingomonas sp. TaxID=158754 RepID=UPI0030F57748